MMGKSINNDSKPKTGKKSPKKSQIVSEDRVSDYGEVYTADREVKAMVDLVKDDAMKIESTFLEPACGDGNFLIEILERKLNTVFDRYRKSQTECEKYLVVAVGSIYGIDILEDNVKRCRDRLFKLFKKMYHQKCKSYYSPSFEMVIRYILERNIVCGNALSMKKVILKKDMSEQDILSTDILEGDPIIFSQWSIAMGCNVKRRDFLFQEILRTGENKTKKKESKDTVLEQKTLDIEADMIESFIEQPVREYRAVHYMRLTDYE